MLLLFFKSRSLFTRLRSAKSVGNLALSGAIALCMSASVMADATAGTTTLAATYATTDVTTDNANIVHQAVIEKRFKNADHSVSRAKLIYNDQAYRLIPLSKGNEFELLVHTDDETVSIIDRKREIINEIDLAEDVSSGPQLFTLSQIQRLVSMPGQLDPKPCLLNDGHKDGHKTEMLVAEGLELEAWECNEASLTSPYGFNSQVIEQHYSLQHGRVVYSLFSDGYEYHMRDIQAAQSEALIAKPKNFRNASVEEFFGIVQPIGAYTPSEASQQLGKAAEVNP